MMLRRSDEFRQKTQDTRFYATPRRHFGKPYHTASSRRHTQPTVMTQYVPTTQRKLRNYGNNTKNRNPRNLFPHRNNFLTSISTSALKFSSSRSSATSSRMVWVSILTESFIVCLDCERGSSEWRHGVLASLASSLRVCLHPGSRRPVSSHTIFFLNVCRVIKKISVPELMIGLFWYSLLLRLILHNFKQSHLQYSQHFD